MHGEIVDGASPLPRKMNPKGQIMQGCNREKASERSKGREHRADEQKLDIRRDDIWVEPAREGEDLFIKGYVL